MTLSTPVRDGYHTVTPCLNINGVDQAIKFYQEAFGAEEVMRIPMPDGKIMHAQIRIGDAVIMMADEVGIMNNESPDTLGGTSVSLYLHVENADKTFARAVKLGAQVRRPVEDRFYGHRVGVIADPYGHIWSLATPIENVSSEELVRRSAQIFLNLNTSL